MFFKRTHDFELVRQVFTHPAIYRYMGDDYAPTPEAFEVHTHPCIWYVEARDADGLLGIVSFVPQSRVCWEMHLALLPEARGKRSRELGRLIYRWVFANTECRRIVAGIPETNRLAIAWARRAGMVEFGRNQAAFLTGGRLVALVLVGMSPTQEEDRV